MASAINAQGDHGLLTAAMSAIIGIQLDSSTTPSGSTNQVSLFNHHHKTYSYGDVGDVPYAADNMIEIHVKKLDGTTITCKIDPNKTIEDLKKIVETKDGIPLNQQRLIFAGKQLEDGASLLHYGIHNSSVLHVVIRMHTGGSSSLDPSSLDPRYDYDFTNITDENTEFQRAGIKYVRPCGYKRFAIKVSDKFENLVWIGSSNKSGEWPVSYHGTGRNQTKTMAMDGHNLTKRKKFPFGFGIYSTPDIKVAEKYAIKFSYNNEQYLVILQNRVNPETLVKITADQSGVGEYWISPSDKDVRPYSICVRKI